MRLLVPIGDKLAYTERGVGANGRFPITGLPNQTKNVWPLVDLERKLRKAKKAEAAAEDKANSSTLMNWLGESLNSASRVTSKKSAVDSSGDASLFTSISQSSDSETPSSDSETPSSDRETSSGKGSDSFSSIESEYFC